jgi:monothiol glutaredoxin
MTDNLVFDQIKRDLSANEVVLYMKGTKDAPMCGFSALAIQILDRLNVKQFKDVNVLADPELRQGIKEFTDWPTIPQLYVKGEFVGGSDIMREMYESGELEQLLTEKGVTRAA